MYITLLHTNNNYRPSFQARKLKTPPTYMSAYEFFRKYGTRRAKQIVIDSGNNITSLISPYGGVHLGVLRQGEPLKVQLAIPVANGTIPILIPPKKGAKL